MQTIPCHPITVTDVYRYSSKDPDASHISVLWPNSDTGPWWLVLRWAVVAGRPECVGVDLRSCREPGETWPEALPLWSDQPPPLTQKIWRGMPIMEMIRDVRQHLIQVEADFLQGIVDRTDPDVTHERRLAMLGELVALQQELAGGNALPGNVYEQVARVYRQAWMDGRRPTRAVAEHFTISDSAAAKRVMRARKAGLLPPTDKGVGGLGREGGQA